MFGMRKSDNVVESTIVPLNSHLKGSCSELYHHFKENASYYVRPYFVNYFFL